MTNFGSILNVVFNYSRIIQKILMLENYNPNHLQEATMSHYSHFHLKISMRQHKKLLEILFILLRKRKTDLKDADQW